MISLETEYSSFNISLFIILLLMCKGFLSLMQPVDYGVSFTCAQLIMIICKRGIGSSGG